MRRSLRYSLFCTIPVVGFFAVASAATVFPDVPVGHLYHDPIEALVNAGVVTGNPDGNFYPERQVNRAEMLKLLYKATGKLPDVNSRGCFADVERYSWYENFVCDAAANRFVDGYADGTFRPANPVNRVEALKMITQIIGIPVTDMGTEARQVVKFVDVSISAWYTKYLYAAYTKGILPIAGQDSSRFNPDWPLLRGEAAAMIYNALKADLAEKHQGSSASAPGASSAPFGVTSSATGGGTASSSVSSAVIFDVPFPFESAGKFTARKSVSYRFALDRSVTALTVAILQAGQPGSLTCRLYHLTDSGFSYEYFLGFQDGSTCTLLTTLTPGSYQLELSPSSPDVTFMVKSSVTTGDGNDGFSEAMAIPTNIARTGTLAPGDYADWFKFTVAKETDMQVTASDAAQLSCVIYPMEDVDLYGFSGPACNQHFVYQPGTYVIAIGRKFPADARQTYTLLVQ